MLIRDPPAIKKNQRKRNSNSNMVGNMRGGKFARNNMGGTMVCRWDLIFDVLFLQNMSKIAKNFFLPHIFCFSHSVVHAASSCDQQAASLRHAS